MVSKSTQVVKSTSLTEMNDLFDNEVVQKELASRLLQEGVSEA